MRCTLRASNGPNHLGLRCDALFGHQMALITSDCGAMRVHGHQMAGITCGIRRGFECDGGRFAVPLEGAVVVGEVSADEELRGDLDERSRA